MPEPVCETCNRPVTGEQNVSECFTCKYHGHTVGGTPTTGWPLVSNALGVCPDQVKEEQAAYDRHGVNVEVLPNGDVKIPDPGNYAKALKLNGLFNKAEGFHRA